MSDSCQYEIDGQPISGLSMQVGPTNPFSYSFTTTVDEGFGQAIVIDEMVDGTRVGTATITDYALTTIPEGYSGPYEDFGGAQSVVVVGEFDAFPCFAAGTAIATPDGPVAVEHLAVGQGVTLAAGGFAHVVWLGHRRQRDGTVIRVGRHAFAHGVPGRDLVVSSDHALFLAGVLVPAGLLVNGETIVAEHRREVTLWHVELDRHAVLLAENAPAESYLDTGNRGLFGNCALRYDPLGAARHEPCAEMVFAGERLDRIRAALPIPA